MDFQSKCTACGEPVRETWKVCPMCGQPLARLACPACGAEVKPAWKLCPECGAQLTCPACSRRIPAGERVCRACAGAAAASPPGLLVEPVTGMELVRIPGGAFEMGDLFGDGWDNEVPPRPVRVEGFFLGRTPVTQAQWEAVMDANPSLHKRGGTHPVEQVSWTDVNEFLKRLNGATPGGARFRLPGEAEWEYAARSGGKRELYAGGEPVERVAWTVETSGGATQPVGRKQPNGLGLYDMSGNVWEWCRDVYVPNAAAGSVRKPGGAATERVIRGGSWSLDDWSARCSRRFGFPEDYFGAGLGFRVAAD
jgi:formylglycine-generating enzyme required for sulfatase activity